MIPALAGFARTRGCVLLDFDGPVCSIFGGTPDHIAAQRLRHVLANHGIAVPADIAQVHDPLEVLRWTGNEHRHLVPEVEYELQAAEVDAADTATPTPGAFDVIRYAPELGLAIVSNNSARAIVRYFETHHPDDWSTPYPLFPIIGRDPADPRRMKPNPSAVLAGIRATASAPQDCVMVGDSVTDIQAAQAAGVRSIGYANKPGKADQFAAAGADAIITDMAELASDLRRMGAAA